MGANLQTRIYPSWEAAQKDWPAAVERAAWESGHEYSGEINMLGINPSDLPSPPFHVAADEKEAEDYIADNHPKWEQALVVSLPGGGVMVGGWCAS